MPKFIKANDGLRKITKKQIDEIKKIREPSDTLVTLAKSICIVMKVEPTNVKNKEVNFATNLSYWAAFTGP